MKRQMEILLAVVSRDVGSDLPILSNRSMIDAGKNTSALYAPTCTFEA